MSDANLDALAGLFDVVSGQLEVMNQAATRPDVDRAKLKAQCFDMVLEAVGAQANRLSAQPSAKKLLEKLAQHKKTGADVRMQLIALSEDWKCQACGRDVAGGATVTKRAPLEGELVCKNCGAKTPLTPQGQTRLQKLFGASAAAADWNPATNGFVP